ncbi:transposase [Bacillus thuringiensis]|nr:transposase [Bacillus thuringiensis]
MRWLCDRLQVSVSGFYDYFHRKATEGQRKRKETAAYIVMQFKRLKGRMDYRKLYRYLLNRDVLVSLSQVRQALCRFGLKSKVVSYYKKRKQDHDTFPNTLERSFQPGRKDVPTVVCDITEFRLMNGLKVYFCATLDSSIRWVYSSPFLDNEGTDMQELRSLRREIQALKKAATFFAKNQN